MADVIAVRARSFWMERTIHCLRNRCSGVVSSASPGLRCRRNRAYCSLFPNLICSSQGRHSFSLSCRSRPSSARSPSRLLAARRSQAKYTLISNMATRRWVAVRSLHSFAAFSSQLMTLAVVLGLFGGVRLLGQFLCPGSHQTIFLRRSPKPLRTSVLW